MKFPTKCSECFANSICSQYYGGYLCKTFHKLVEKKFKSTNTQRNAILHLAEIYNCFCHKDSSAAENYAYTNEDDIISILEQNDIHL